MRILFVVEHFGPQDGRGRVVMELCRCLLAQGDEVQVVAGSAADAPLPAVQVHRVACPKRWPWSLRTLGFATSSAWAVARLRSRVDVVHAHGPTLARADVYTCHGAHRGAMAVAAELEDASGWGLRAADLRRLRWLLPILEAPLRARRVIALTEVMAAELGQHCGVPPERIVVIPNGVESKRFAPKGESVHRDPETAVAIFVGHDLKRKGLVPAMQAIAHWRQGSLLVAGCDPNNRQIQTFMERRAVDLGVQERVHFLGAQDKIAALYGAADVLIAPSAYEGFCLCVLEALAAGLPVVGSPAALPQELGPDGPALRRVALQAEPVALAAALEAARRTPREEVARHAGQIVAAFSWERVARATRAVYGADSSS